ncbi:MAG: hypothetical protein GY866_19245 [Proteobacteria bacterium]|nr:hypothetical protein [Pseudomonadota bacterium]
MKTSVAMVSRDWNRQSQSWGIRWKFCGAGCPTSCQFLLIHPRPITEMEAKFSLDYCVARAVLDRDIGPDQFKKVIRRRFSPEILARFGWGVTVIPVAVTLIAIVFVHRYDITRARHAEILQELATRKTADTEVKP